MGEDAKWKRALQSARSCEDNIPKPQYRQQKCKLLFDLHLQSDLSTSGWNFNIGDSSNNAYGGDPMHWSCCNAAVVPMQQLCTSAALVTHPEVHNVNDDLFIYSNILPRYENIANKETLLVDLKRDVMGTYVTVTVGDELLEFDNHRGAYYRYQSPYLFTLNRQKPTYGSVNYDIFFSMNRVVYPYSYTSRTGVGLCKVVIKAVDCDTTSSGGSNGGSNSGSRTGGGGDVADPEPISVEGFDPNIQ